MHEVSIVQSVLDIAIENCEGEGYKKIDSISLKIGKASGVMLDALYFAFDTVKLGTLAEKASLIIDEVPVGGCCNSCNSDFTVEEKFIFKCPECGADDFRVTSGRELEIIELEVS
ncbi:MAG: hydrogenase maturation nickel metallochaperone HypA [Nitrospirota bacterium]|nr:MAG: hydrogenase maturation nickel metallochaperone HypA [Nitrospirota bacterium]